MNPTTTLKAVMIAEIDPAARPALTIAAIFFIIVNLLAGAYIIRNWGRLFGEDASVDGDKKATRYLQIIVITIPWLILTGRLVVEVVEFWIK
jgi:Na+-driven multidrug efflux pump